MSEASGLPLVAVAAVARNGVIGAEGGMPWSIPSDLKRYRRLTMGTPMIMGRKTLQSIGRALDGRDSVVLTRQKALDVEGAILAHGPDEALAIARRCAGRRGSDTITLVGGAEVYELMWDHVDRIALTEIDASPEGDARFPAIDRDAFECAAEEPWSIGEKDTARTRFKMYVRRTHGR